MGFEDYSEQPVLSPSVEEIVFAHNRAKIGTRRAEEQESSNSKMFSPLIEMREYMNSSRKS